MMEFKIIATADKSQQATYQHEGQQLTLGQSEGDMIIDDPTLAPLQLRVFWGGSGFLLENLDESVEVRLNGHAIDGSSPLKERDNISMGRTTINFSRLDLNPLKEPDPFEHPQAGARFVEGSKEKAILDALAGLEQSHAPSPPPLPSRMPPLPGKQPPLPKPPLPPKKS